MVAQVGGRGSSLIRALIRVRRERERAGRALPNLQMTPEIGVRPRLQEVGPHGWEIERRPGGLQVWGRTNQTIDNALETIDTPDRKQTAPKERPWMRVRARARPGTPPTPRLPYNNLSPPVGCFMAPHRCLHCDDIPDSIFPLPPYSIDDPDPHPIMKTYFPLTIPPSLTQTPPHNL